ncbi:hypothetical protein AAE478_009786 [Parahypoxylon ruwenzoriense]
MSPFGFDTICDEVATAFADQIKGRIFLITGTTAGGLGANAATTLARQRPAHIILVGRNKAKVEPVLQEIASITPAIKTSFVTCELSDFDSVRAAAKEINDDAAISHIDVVINNAGVMAIREYTLDKQGYELGLSANHLGHFLLTNLILPKILAAGPGARIVNVSSQGHQIGPFRFSDWNFSKGAAYEPWTAYGQSKTANVLFAVELARRLAGHGARAYSVHPGSVLGTQLGVHLQEADFRAIPEITRRNTGHDFGGAFGGVFDRLKQLPQGTAPLLAAALDPAFDDRSGAYVVDCQIEPAEPYAEDPDNARKLWALSEELVGQKFDL